MANTRKKSLNYDPALILWIEKELKKNGDLVFDTLTKDQFEQWQRYERERPFNALLLKRPRLVRAP